MQLTLTRSGGVLGSALPPVVVDTATLDPMGRSHLEGLVRAANFFSLPDSLTSTPSGPDRFQYDLEIQDSAGRKHSVRFGEEHAPAPLLELAERVRLHSRE